MGGRRSGQDHLLSAEILKSVGIMLRDGDAANMLERSFENEAPSGVFLTTFLKLGEPAPATGRDRASVDDFGDGVFFCLRRRCLFDRRSSPIAGEDFVFLRLHFYHARLGRRSIGGFRRNLPGCRLGDGQNEDGAAEDGFHGDQRVFS